jgi:hypothetical protein
MVEVSISLLAGVAGWPMGAPFRLLVVGDD